MDYISTRDKNVARTASQAILQGISEEGGLFVPAEIPALEDADFARLCAGGDYCAAAELVLGKYLADFTPEEITACVRAAYTGGRFEKELPAPVSRLGEDTYVLELWHGPTCAFKDMALQILPHLLAVSARKNGVTEKIVILTATSGDTGKAALEGFADAPGTEIAVFYPQDGVSEIQKQQMRTQRGANVAVCGVKGNFDDTQSGVKQIFTDAAFRERLKQAGMRFSSANSINWGRLLPQIVYYVYAYCELVRDEQIAMGDALDVAVPTGNFGNILAAYYAKRMGVPIRRLICASNRNNVLTDFIQTGVYDKNREFHATISPSMDILISSNLERLLFELSGRDDALVRGWMDSLAAAGRYQIPDAMRESLQALFCAGYCGDGATRETLLDIFTKYAYLCDTHTAVACKVCREVIEATPAQQRVKTLVVSTASAFKFANDVCQALGCPVQGTDLTAPLAALAQYTGCAIPAPLSALAGLPVRFDKVCERQDMARFVESTLGI